MQLRDTERRFRDHEDAVAARARAAHLVPVDRDEAGIKYSDDPRTNVAHRPVPVEPVPPVCVGSRADAEQLGWTFFVEPERTRDLGGNLFERIPGSFAAEKTCAFRADDPPRAHRQAGSTLEKLLANIESFEQRRSVARAAARPVEAFPGVFPGAYPTKGSSES